MIRFPGNKNKTPVSFPAVLSKSRDYNAIENLLTSVFNYFYTLSVESKNIHNPKRCEADLLPLLAQYYRYEYTNVKDVSMEREIISMVPELHHNKGTVIGINNALSLSKIDKTDGVSIPWFYDKTTNIITVIVFNGLETYKMMELLALVVPLGTKIISKPGTLIKSSEEIKMHSWTEINYGPIEPNKQWYVTPNNVWKTVWDPEKELYHTYVDYQRNIGNDDMKLNTGDISNNTAGTRVGNTEIAGNETSVPDVNNEEQ